MAKKFKTHIVKDGDTISKIATDNGISVGQLKELNNLQTNNLVIGQKLIVKP